MDTWATYFKVVSNSCKYNIWQAYSYSPCIPREFSRKPRSLSEYKQWKATELRLFLIYVGPVVLKGVLSRDMYSNFMALSVVMRLLLSPSLCEYYLQYSEQLLKYFVETFSGLYGCSQLVYNVHSIIHLADDARRYGALDGVSAFKFESYLGKIKKLVRRPQNPVAQIVRRVIEGHCHINTLSVISESNVPSNFKQPHLEGPVPIQCRQYKQYCGNE